VLSSGWANEISCASALCACTLEPNTVSPTAQTRGLSPLSRRTVEALNPQIDPHWRAHCAVVIPCLNEANTIADLVRQTVVYLPKVVVVNDGSSDATAQGAESAGAEVLSFGSSRGKGAALTAGWTRASQLGFTWALTLDGDGQHAAADIPKFFADLPHDKPMLVIGNRMHNPAAMPWVRRKVNYWMSARLSRRVGLPLADSQCGFRLVHLGALREMALATQHFEIESELILAAARLGIPIRFVPIQVIYKRGSSKISPLRDTVRWFRWFLGGTRR